VHRQNQSPVPAAACPASPEAHTSDARQAPVAASDAAPAPAAGPAAAHTQDARYVTVAAAWWAVVAGSQWVEGRAGGAKCCAPRAGLGLLAPAALSAGAAAAVGYDETPSAAAALAAAAAAAAVGFQGRSLRSPYLQGPVHLQHK